MLLYNQKGFTLTEIIVLIIILGIIAGFTIPNYRKSVEAEFERTARFQLENIYKAEQIYRAKAKDYWPDDPSAVGTDQDITAINDALFLNITEEGMTYICHRDASDHIKCTATRDGTTFQLGICVDIDDTICCDAGTCPSASLPACGC